MALPGNVISCILEDRTVNLNCWQIYLVEEEEGGDRKRLKMYSGAPPPPPNMCNKRVLRWNVAKGFRPPTDSFSYC